MKDRILGLTPIALAASLLLAGQAHAVGNGTMSHGSDTDTISKNGSTTTVNQTSNRLIINWDNMDVAKGETLNFAQKNASSAVLNRINSATATSILGALNANGRVFIVNPNGVLIGNGAKINVGSLVASSLNISDAEFMSNNLNFEGGGTGVVSNQGEINATESVAMIGPRVTNNGTIKSTGNVVLAAGDAIRLSFVASGFEALVAKASLQALIDNGGIILTEDGNIALTAWARDAIARTVINNTGTLEAHSFQPSEVTLESLGDGNVTLAGKTSGNTITLKGRNVSFDGDVSAENLDVYAPKAATTDRAKLRASYANLSGGDFDFTRGSNAFYSTTLDVNSADIVLDSRADGTPTVTGSAQKNLRLRAKDGLQLDTLVVGGKLDASAQDDLKFSNLQVDDDITLHGKNVTGMTKRNNRNADGLTTQGNVNVTADERVSMGRIDAQGDVNVTAGMDISQRGALNGKNVRMVARTGDLSIGALTSTESAHLEGGKSIQLSDHANVGKNLTLATQGDVTLEDGVAVGGDLEYKLGADSKVTNNGQANDVQGKTTGLDKKPDDNKQPDEDKKPDDNKQPDEDKKPDDNKDRNQVDWTDADEAELADWAKKAEKGDLDDSIRTGEEQLADLKTRLAAETNPDRKQTLEQVIYRVTREVEVAKQELARRQAAADADKKKADAEAAKKAAEEAAKKKAQEEADKKKTALDAVLKQLQNLLKSIFSIFGWR